MRPGATSGPIPTTPRPRPAAVWERPQAFEAERITFFALTDALAQAAQTRDKAAAQAAYDKVHASCKSCHDEFKK